MKALIISDDRFEDGELLVPYYRLKEERVDVDIAALHRGKIRGKHGIEVEANLSINEVDPSRYDLLFLPGGMAPAALRKNVRVLELAQHFMGENKPIAAICHGPQILAAAGVIKNRNLTSYSAVAPEVEEAGAKYHNAEVVVDGNLITSRHQGDLPAFLRELAKLIK